MTDEDRLIVEVRERVALATLNRPDRLNALDDALIAALDALAERLEDEPDIRVLVLTGAGRCFCAGADIEALSRMPDGAAFAAYVTRLTAMMERIRRLPQPSVAALHGVAYGGGLELALACDLRVAAERTRIGLPEIALGVLPGAAGTQRLPRMIPPGIAKEVILTGEPMLLDDAVRWGLINRAAGTEDHVEVALRLAGRLAEGPPEAMATATRLIDDGLDLPLDEAILLERREVARLFDLPDRAEGIAAFLEKRRPRFGLQAP